MDRNNSNDRTTAEAIAAIAIIASIALLALAGLGGVSCAAEGENAGGSDGEIAGAAVSAASVTDSINYQGRLADSSGSPLTGTYTMTFGLYDVSTGGTALATDTHSVEVTDGLFNTHIDFGTDYFDGRALWLGVMVGTDSEMTPRQELRTVPFAIKASDADTIKGYGADDFILRGQPDVITSAMIMDSTITCTDLAANSVGSSEIATNAVRADEIRWSLNHQDSDLNGGLISLTNTADGTAGNYPAGICGGANGDPGSHRVIGVMGLAPKLGSGSPVGSFPTGKIGVAGAVNDGYGVVGVSSGNAGRALYGTASGDSGYGVYASSVKSYGVYGKSDSTESAGVYARGIGSGADLILGGNAVGGVGDDGKIYSDPAYASSDIYLVTNDGLRIDLDNDGDGEDADFEIYDKDDDRIFDVDESGEVYADGAFHSGGADVAEYFPTPEDPEPGTVMVIDPAGGSKLRSSTKAYDTTVAGIVSTAPGVSLGTKEDGNDGEKLIAVAGRVPCKVDASYAAIKPGDLLTTSDTQGHAMKAQPVEIRGIEIYRPGTTIGKALELLAAGTGTIEVLVTLQ